MKSKRIDWIKYRIIKVYIPANYYYEKEVEYYYIQKKGWFGWKTLSYVYDGNWGSHMSWSYFKSFHQSDLGNDAFKSRKKAKLFLETFLGQRKACILL